jgi:hypothetical protein
LLTLDIVGCLFSPDLLIDHSITRLYVAFVINLQASSAARIGSVTRSGTLPYSVDPQYAARSLCYQDIQIWVSRSGGKYNDISIDYKLRFTKTNTGKVSIVKVSTDARTESIV